MVSEKKKAPFEEIKKNEEKEEKIDKLKTVAELDREKLEKKFSKKKKLN